MRLVKETWLLIRNLKFAVDGGKDALHLSHSEHSAEESVAGIVAVVALIHYAARLVGERHAVVHTHGQGWIFLFKDAAELDKVGTTAQMTGFREVAVGEDVATTQVNEVGARCKLLGHSHYVVVGTSRE